MHQLRCDWIHMPDIRKQETQTRTDKYIHSSSAGAGFTLDASEIMVRSSSKLSRIKTHRTNITSIDFYLGLFLAIFHKSILLRKPLCPLNIAKNVSVEPFLCALFPISPDTPTYLKRHPQGTRTGTFISTLYAAFAKYHHFISQTLTNSWSPLGSISSLWCLWAEFLFQIKSLLLYKNTWETKLCCHRSADFSFQCGHLKVSGQHPHPLHTGKEKSGFLVFKFKRPIKIQQIFPLMHQENEPNSFYISG